MWTDRPLNAARSRGGGRGLEAELAVGRLAPALAAVAVHLGLQFERGGGADFINVPTGKAGAVGAVPVLFEKHRTLASRASSWLRCLHLSGHSSGGKEPVTCWIGPLKTPPRLAVGFGLKGRPTRPLDEIHPVEAHLAVIPPVRRSEFGASQDFVTSVTIVCYANTACQVVTVKPSVPRGRYTRLQI